MKSICGLFLLTFALLSCIGHRSTQKTLTLKYDEPAAKWKESLPIGNGRLGTMIAGNVFSDTLVINEETVWSGGIHDYNNPDAFTHLNEIRDLILDKKYNEALAVGDKYMIGKPRNLQRYQPLGDLVFNFHHKGKITDYQRTLSLDNAVVNISYKCEGINYNREIFASHPDDVIVIRYTTDSDKGLNLDLIHTSKHESNVKVEGSRLKLSGTGQEGRGIKPDIKFESQLEIVKGKEFVQESNNGFTIKGAREVVLLYTAATNCISFKDISGDPLAKCKNILASAGPKSYKELKDRHIADYSELFKRVEIHLGSEEVPFQNTNVLIDSVRAHGSVPYLDELFYQMSRYLIIAGSRGGTQPLNLQGIWNNDMAPPWDCKWTLNINTPMNYWIVEAGNLADCHEPLFELLYDLYETGSKTAREHYGCRGFVAHHNTDLWRAATPVDGANWGLWTFGGAWLTRHLWEHYRYSQDVEFLKKAYPYMKDASLFFFDYLSVGNDGYLVTSPTVSFEQSYIFPNGEKGRLCEGPTMDNQILRDLFNNCLKAAKIMNDESAYMDSLEIVKNRLRPTTINTTTGELMEWAWPAKPIPVSGQLAPLWGVHPGYEINYKETPELAAAAEKTIRTRDPHVSVYETSGSWVSGTRINFWARLNKGDDAYNVYTKTIKENLFPNVLVSFYPKKYFMIDGNLGTAAAFNEMLVQSQRISEDGTPIIELLPALPTVWKLGSIKGIRARGGFELDIHWQDGELTEVTVKSTGGTKAILLYKGEQNELNLAPRKTTKLKY